MFGVTKKDLALTSISAVAGGIITLVSALALGYIQAMEPALQFIRNDSPPLKEKDKSTSIYFASVYNVGNKEAEDVDCTLRRPKCRILSHGITPHAIRHEYKEEGDTASVRIAVLNPNEAVTVQLLASGDAELPLKPEVSVRAKGVVGIEKGAPTAQQSGTFWSQLQWIFSFALTIGIVAILPGAVMSLMYEVTKTIGKRWERTKNRFKIKVKLEGEERIRVTILEGEGKSRDAVVVVPHGEHQIIKRSFEDLKKLGDGNHVILKTYYSL